MVNPVKTRKAAALEAEVAQDGETVEPEGEATEATLIDPPKSPPAAQKPPSTPTTSPDIIELHRRVSHVNRKLTLMSQHADMICPGEIINHLQRVEEETKRFRDKKEISVAKALVAQNVYCETLSLTFGANTATLFKLSRFSILAEYKKLSTSQREVKMLPTTSAAFKELKAVSYIIWEVVKERNKAADWTINFRDGIRALVDTTYHTIFHDLLGVIKNPSTSTLSRATMTEKVKETRTNLATLFSDSSIGVVRLDEWLEAEQMDKNFDKQQAVTKLREFFPYPREVHEKAYNFLGLKECDRHLDDGIADWNDYQQDPPGYSSDEEPTRRKDFYGDSPKAGTSLDTLYDQIKRTRSSYYEGLYGKNIQGGGPPP
jgi:hypothetical protein